MCLSSAIHADTPSTLNGGVGSSCFLVEIRVCPKTWKYATQQTTKLQTFHSTILQVREKAVHLQIQITLLNFYKPQFRINAQ